MEGGSEQGWRVCDRAACACALRRRAVQALAIPSLDLIGWPWLEPVFQALILQYLHNPTQVVREGAPPARGPRQGAASPSPPSPERRRWATPAEAPGAPRSAYAAPSVPGDGAAGGRVGGGNASRREPAPALEPVAPRPKTIEEIRAVRPGCFGRSCVAPCVGWGMLCWP